MTNTKDECANVMNRYSELNTNDRILFRTLLDLTLILFSSTRETPTPDKKGE